MNLGDTFYWQSARSPSRHLYIVSLVNGDGSIVAFNATTDCDDRTCVLPPGSHPCLPDESLIFYRYGEVFSAADVAAHLKDNAWDLRAPMDAKTVRRIQDGIVNSDRTSPHIRALYLSAPQPTPIIIRRQPRPKRPKPVA